MSLWSLLCIVCVLLNQTVLVDCRCSGQIYCPRSWLVFKDNCYLLVREAKNYDAEQHCQSLSERGRPAHLASILDEEENQFVAHYTQSAEPWIGYNDLDVEGVYTWLDGSPVGYESWKPGYPVGDAYGDQDCILMNNGPVWKEYWCYGGMYSVCKIKRYTF